MNESSGLTEADRARITAASAAAEATTAGEIYVVVARRSDDYRLMPVLWAALAALLLPWPLHLLTDLSSTAILLIQAVYFVASASLLSHPALRHRVTPPAMVAEATRKNAVLQFMAHGVHLTESRTGVLIYVSLAERRVEIVADAGIHGKVDAARWVELANDVTAAARAGRLVEGILVAVPKAGELLALHCPRTPQDRNELSDRVVEI